MCTVIMDSKLNCSNIKIFQIGVQYYNVSSYISKGVPLVMHITFLLWLLLCFCLLCDVSLIDDSLNTCFLFMLTLTQPGQTAATSATVQTPDSANLKVNQVFEVNTFLSWFFFSRCIKNYRWMLLFLRYKHLSIYMPH